MSLPIPTPGERPWEGEQVVSLELARDLIADQFQELSHFSIRPLGSGWDNTAYLVNQEILFRFPRRKIATFAMKAEINLLPGLQDLPLPVPHPIYRGEPTRTFPWPWAGYPLIKGEPAYRFSLSEEERSHLAEPMAIFIRALHKTVFEDSVSIPQDSWGRFDEEKRIPQIRSYLAKLKSVGLLSTLSSFNAVIDAVKRISLPEPQVLTHGDLDARHWMVRDGSLTGVIDWGDIHMGVAAVDLLVPWTFLPPQSRRSFWEAYGADSLALQCWSRFRALNQSAVTAVYAMEINDTELLRESLGALERVRID